MPRIKDIELYLTEDDGELSVNFDSDLAENIASEFFVGVYDTIRSMLGYLGEGESSANAKRMGNKMGRLTFPNEENSPLRGIATEGDDWYYYSVEYDTGILHRPSLLPDRYGGLDDVVAAFSVGWDISSKKAPRGLWVSRNMYAYAKLRRAPNSALVAFAEHFEKKYSMARVSLPSEWGRD